MNRDSGITQLVEVWASNCESLGSNLRYKKIKPHYTRWSLEIEPLVVVHNKP